MVKMVNILGLPISSLGFSETVGWIRQRVKSKTGVRIYCSNLNEVILARERREIKEVLLRASLLTADGMPLVWLMRKKIGYGERVYGPDLLEGVLMSDEKKEIKHFFIGSTVDNLKKIESRICSNFGYLKNNLGFYSPPFMERFDRKEINIIATKIRDFKPGIVWIGMGAEKQTLLADKLSRKIDGIVWIAVGAAFDFLAGTKKQCPRLIREFGGEWLFRWIMEPRRLTKRYWRIIKFVLGGELKYENEKK
jgi:N-acetylglucosaminyldiphosphoundecaprenol N-acetyl-beta-D-mannosaminyltransferase